MKSFRAIIAIAALALVAGCVEADLGPYQSTVGIRQVTHNGELLPPAMRLEVTGGTLTSETADDGVLAYKLDLSGYDGIGSSLASLDGRVSALEEPTIRSMSTYTAPAGYSSIAASPGEALTIDDSALGADEGVKVILPAASAENAGKRIRVVAGYSDHTFDISGVRIGIVLPPGQTTIFGGITTAFNGDDCHLLVGPHPLVTLLSTGSAWVVDARSYAG